MIPLRVLMVDDSEDDVFLVARALTKGGFDLKYERVEGAAGMEKALREKEWDLVISDYHMPNFDCFGALEVLKKTKKDLPFIVLSGAISEETAVSAMKAGAQDYIMKQNLKRLVPAVQRELEEARIREARRKAEEKIEHQAYHDAVTGLPNLLLFKDRLRQALAMAHRYGRTVAVIVMDLDNFKLVNTALGWAAGDVLLAQVALQLAQRVREEDTLARLGEDEFLLFSIGSRQPHDATAVAERITKVFQSSFTVEGEEVNIKATFGISLYPNDGTDPETLIKNAEAALYRTKSSGKGGYQFYSNDMNEHAYDRFRLQNSLHRALAHKEFTLYYQVQVELEKGSVSGAEALLRWNHPDRGVVLPGYFIPLAEESGEIVLIGEWVMQKACEQIVAWRKEGLPEMAVAVNLSAVQFQHQNLIETIRCILERTGAAPALLELEITESAAMQDPDKAKKILAALSLLGTRISIDDFGTGYSSLSYLKDLPVRQIKIDRSFVQNMHSDPKAAAIVSAIINLGHGLGLDVVAEGVELKAQLDALRGMGCDKVQGYYIGRPVTAEVFTAQLQTPFALRD